MIIFMNSLRIIGLIVRIISGINNNVHRPTPMATPGRTLLPLVLLISGKYLRVRVLYRGRGVKIISSSFCKSRRLSETLKTEREALS